MAITRNDQYILYRWETGDIAIPTHTSEWSIRYDTNLVVISKILLENIGARQYYSGIDWILRMALCYIDDSTGQEEGEDLTNAAITFNLKTITDTTIVTKTIGSGLELASQVTARSSGGTQGDFRVTFDSNDTPDPGRYFWNVIITQTNLSWVAANGIWYIPK